MLKGGITIVSIRGGFGGGNVWRKVDKSFDDALKSGGLDEDRKWYLHDI